MDKSKELLQPYVRAVTDKDREKLPKYSYSKLEQFTNCPLAYHMKYNRGFFTNEKTLALELGTLMHLLCELKGRILLGENSNLFSFSPTDYDHLLNIMEEGYDVETSPSGKPGERIAGIKELKERYWEIWNVPDSEGHTYDWKIDNFKKVLREEMQKGVWQPQYFELPFEFVYADRAIFHGFIDRIDRFNDYWRVVDYKTSKKTFSQDKLTTSMQCGIYCLAVLNAFDVVPTTSLYRFIFLDDYQTALTSGWEKRLIKKLNKTLDSIDECEQTQLWKPNPTPLCHWCFASDTNPDAHEYKGECDYNLLWTPKNKSFEKKNEWNPETPVKENVKRSLIF